MTEKERAEVAALLRAAAARATETLTPIMRAAEHYKVPDEIRSAAIRAVTQVRRDEGDGVQAFDNDEAADEAYRKRLLEAAQRVDAGRLV